MKKRKTIKRVWVLQLSYRAMMFGPLNFDLGPGQWYYDSLGIFLFLYPISSSLRTFSKGIFSRTSPVIYDNHT